MTYQEKLQQVIDKGLCTRCGACVGLSEGRIRFTDKTGDYLPKIEEELPEKLSKDIWEACSGKEVNFPALDKFTFTEGGENHKYIGTYRDLYIAYSKNENLRRSGGSAGVITNTLIWLLKTGKVQGAVVLGMSKEEPWMNRPYIATSPEQVLEAAQSKYTISSVNEILTEMEKFEGDLAYVGLPCQVHSIRKMQAEGNPAVKNIKYIIAPFCGLNLHFSSVVSFLRSNGEKDYRQIRDIQFRHGEWPGSMRVEMNDGKVIQLPKFHANYLIPFHMMKRCMLCIDAANEFADISVGDAWAPVYEERGKGFSFVVVRSQAGKQIAEQMQAANEIELQPIEIDQAVKMHSHMYDNKKRGAFIRIGRAKVKPDYNLPFPENISFGRRLFETSLNFIFVVLRTRLMIWAFEKLPQKFVGSVFDRFKVFWKRITYSVKRKEL